MKKIGLVLSYKETNYGAQLQAYATQVMVEKLGHNTEIIDYVPKNGDRHIILCRGLIRFLYEQFLFKRRAKKHTSFSDPLFLENKQKRIEQFHLFIDRRLHNIVKVFGYTELASRGKDYDAVLIGSDQKWTPGFSFGNVNSLRFVPNNVRRVSYATSLGVSEYPKYCWPTSRKAWKRIDFLSVREQQGADIIKQVCGSDISVHVVVDPTYLMTKSQWEELIPVEKKSEQKYVFCYFLGNDDTSKQIARRFADEKKLKLVSVLSKESYSPIDQSYADELVIGNTPEDFINWIRGAEYVFTDSFHGTAFSVINEKQFFIFFRKRAEATSRNSRIDNILSKWGLKDRLILPGSQDVNLSTLKDIDYEAVNTLVDKEREKSLAFLKEALHFDDNK
jgi:hypothetical protein